MLSIHHNVAIDTRLPGMYHNVMNYDILYYEKTTVLRHRVVVKAYYYNNNNNYRDY